MVVQHNISAMTANRYYGINNSTLGKSMEKLSSGYAINRAGDNAAGLAVSEKMRAQIAGLTQASKNAQDGISMVQTYEGALQETDSILQRMRTIAVQSANGSYQNDVDRDALQLEFDQLNDELNQIADTDFNGVVVLNGGVMSDGTVANDPSKIADRPTIDDIKTSPNAAFTYNSNVNGTVDSAGNGSLTINGVSVKLKSGEGSVELGDKDSTMKTSYKASNISVNNGKVSGDIDATETYKINEGTTSITIHGSTYTVKGSQLIDEKGQQTELIDNLDVTVNKDQSVVLSGSYKIEDSKIESKTFINDAKDDVTGTTMQGTYATNANLSEPAISGYNISDDGAGATNCTLKVNGNKISVVSGSGTIQDGALTYTAGSIAVDEDSKTVSGTVAITGTVGSSVEKTGGNTVKSTYYGSTGQEVTATDYLATGNGKSTKATYTWDDAVTGRTLSLTMTRTKDSGGNVTTASNVAGFASNGTTIYAKADGTLTATVDSDCISKFTVSYSDADGTFTVSEQENTVLQDAGIGEDTKLYTDASGGTTKILKVVGDTGFTVDNNKAYVTLSNGVEVKADGSVNCTYTLSDSLDVSNMGNFTVSKGVSSSDTFNHGTANLTFADNMTLQVGARSKDAVTFNFTYTTNGIGNLKSDLNASARGLGTDQVSVRNQEDANAAIDAIDNAINKVSMIRGTFGAIQNRLEHKINNIDTNAENITAAESRIRDTQMDQEMMKFTSAQILSQASQSMLAQANSLPQGVLQLLG